MQSDESDGDCHQDDQEEPHKTYVNISYFVYKA